MGLNRKYNNISKGVIRFFVWILNGIAHFSFQEVAKPFNTYISLVPKAYVLPHRLVEGAEGRGGSFVVALRNRV